MNNDITLQLSQMGFHDYTLNEIRNKDGIFVYRVDLKSNSYILKYFCNNENTREIENYKILSGLGIPTISVKSYTANAILLEDLERSNLLRLATGSDLSDPLIAKLIAKWYKQLHKKGKQFLKKTKKIMYDETDFLTIENINSIKQKTGYNPVWQTIIDNFSNIRNIINYLERTLTYNDFYYTNLAVAKDMSQSLMFDFNLLGKGYIYADIRNVCSSLSCVAKEAFLSEYGEFNDFEKTVDDAISPLISMYYACKRKTFPNWGTEALNQLNNGDLLSNIIKLLGENK